MPNYMTVKEASIRWNVAERSVRVYCAQGRVEGAVRESGEWRIPQNAKKPVRINEKPNKNYLLERLREEKKHGVTGGIYHRLQIDMTYNSNHMEGSTLTHDQTRWIFETKTIGLGEHGETANVDDIVETINHFAMMERTIEFANYELSEAFIKELHRILKKGTSDASRPWFTVGAYKKRPNEVGGEETVAPRLVPEEMKKLLEKYHQKEHHTFEEIVEFHARFEKIHPFQDGNGRVGRMIAFKECLKNNIVPFLILDQKKAFYYRGLKEWERQRGYLLDTCLDGQDWVKACLDYFGIPYSK